jgi:ABC-type uncharacterized transport system substrate-binding protein
MRRRALIAVLSGVALIGAPTGGTAQQPANMFRIGVLSPAGGSTTRVFDAFREALRTLGYIEGRNITIDYAFAAGDNDRLPALAENLARSSVALIVTDGGERVAEIAQKAAPNLPIVMATAGDPLRAGLIASFAHPGGNVTGFTLLSFELSGKRVELLREILPKVSRVVALWIPGLGDTGLRATTDAARSLGFQLDPIGVASPAEIGASFAAAAAAGAQALIVVPGAMFWNERKQIVALAEKQHLPAVYPEREYADDGGLFSYGPSVPDNFRRAAGYVDKILKGAKPADLPVQQPTTFELVINLKAAKALGITVPQALLARADEVIE